MLHTILHLSLHALIPAIVAKKWFAQRWIAAFIIMVSTMVVDLDHLLATPIFDPNRCSIGFHPLHTRLAITFYCILIVIPKVRLIGLGLMIHMMIDGMDCLWMGTV